MTQRAEWEKAKDSGIDYLPARYKEDGFIHTSKIEQILPTANRLYKGEKDLVLLAIDENKIPSKIVEEPSSSGEMFAHIYGSLPMDAVVKIYDFKSAEGGVFIRLPFEEGR